MSTIGSTGNQRQATKYAHLNRLRTINNATLLLILLVILVSRFFNLSLIATYVLYGLSIAASVVGLCCIAAYHWPSKREGR